MSYLVLARKYRPQAFSEVIAQEHITQTLTNAIVSGRVAHAILFSGPRGTGKTTVARILAKALNCKQGPAPVPCNKCRSCQEITGGNAVDVFEIDGASNNSVDQVRELRENIKYMPAHSQYKIYIIDEVHMLSTAAFNALLKTLEEPPAHVLFMFATTEAHKIPITILSRCQRHDFRRIRIEAITNHMAMICRQENFGVSAESLSTIAREAGGSMRDALSLLDQVLSCSDGSAPQDYVLDILGVIDRKILFDISAAILAGDITAILDTLDDIYNRGHDINALFSELLEFFRNLLVVRMGRQVDKLVDLPANEIDMLLEMSQKTNLAQLHLVLDMLFKEEVSVRLSPQPKLTLEMAFIRILQAKPVLPIDVLIEKLDDLRQSLPPTAGAVAIAAPRNSDSLNDHPTVVRSQSQSTELPPKAVQLPKVPDAAASHKQPVALPENLDDIWGMVSQSVAKKHPSLLANLERCRLKKMTETSLEIEVVGNHFTLNMLRRDKNLTALKDAAVQLFGKEKKIVLKSGDSSGSDHHQKKNMKTKKKTKC